MSSAPKHPTETSAYWRELARHERAFAAEDRRRRGATYESIVIHERNALAADERAEAIDRAGSASIIEDADREMGIDPTAGDEVGDR